MHLHQEPGSWCHRRRLPVGVNALPPWDDWQLLDFFASPTVRRGFLLPRSHRQTVNSPSMRLRD